MTRDEIDAWVKTHGHPDVKERNRRILLMASDERLTPRERSAGRIAEALGIASRNIVIGVLNRSPFKKRHVVKKSCSLPIKPSNNTAKQKPYNPFGDDGTGSDKRMVTKPPKPMNNAPAINPAPQQAMPELKGVGSFTFADNPGCRWPFGEGPFTFCGAVRVQKGGSYCAHHERVARQGPPKPLNVTGIR